MIRPQWVWELDDAEGGVLATPVSPVFTTQYDAEQWLGETWRTLAAEGAAVARLLHDGTQATAPVELRAR
ncbi:hypothetical protein [Cellulosimicrobium sp. NPDC055967]|uniref:hypothetical protein n=1 Tax=Cellulosimicrobium sp. NPDC055967 TaxID=3345670 RepID=UPI0035E11E5F